MANLGKKSFIRWLRAFKYIFTPVLVIFLMSHNVGAIELGQDVQYVTSTNDTYIRITSRSCVSGGCGWNNENWSNYFRTAWTNANSVTRIYDLYISSPASNRQEGTTFQYQSGDYIVNTLYIWQNGLSISAHNYVTGIAYGGFHPVTVVDVSFEELSANSGMIKIISRVNSPYYDDNDLKFVGNPAGTGLIDLQGGYTANGTTGPAYMRPGVAVLYRPRGQIDNSNAINSINNQLPSITNNLQDMNNALNDIKDSIQEQNEQEQDAVQDASDAADTAANENSSNQSTTNLIGVISNFISAITNFSGSDCNITLAFPSYAGGSMTVNVCQNKDKAGNIISVFTSLSLIVFYLPLAFKLLSMIYNEIRSFTNG